MMPEREMTATDIEKQVSVGPTHIRFRSDGIVEYDYGLSEVDEQHARAVIAAATAAMAQPRPSLSLVQLARVRSVTRQARTFFASSPENLAIASRVALVGASPIARVIGNFFLGLNKPPVPVRLFATEAEAIAWLKGKAPWAGLDSPADSQVDQGLRKGASYIGRA